MANVASVPRARWEVIWIGNDGRRRRVKCGEDLQAAVTLHAKGVVQGKKGVTLRCCNVAFAPPEKYADRVRVPLGRSKRTRQIVYKKVVIEPHQFQTRMGAMNARGIWWCPYCAKMRRFVKRSGFRSAGVWNDNPHYACPMCDISNNDGQVRRYNPVARTMEFRQGRRRGKRRTTTDDEE